MCPLTTIYFLIFGLIIFFAISFFLKTSGSIDQTLGGLGGRRTGMYSGTFDVEGRPANFYYYSGSRNRPSELRIFVDGDFSANCVIRREGGGDAFAKSIGLNREVQLNDPALDAQFYFECDDQIFVQELMRSADVKMTVRDILASFNRIEIKGKRCTVTMTPCRDLASVDARLMSEVAAQIVKLMACVPVSYSGSGSSTPLTDEFKGSQNLFTGVGIACSFAGGILTLWGMASFEPLRSDRVFWASLWFSLPLLVLFVAYAYHELAGRSTSARAFLGVASFALFGLVFSGWGGAMVLNGSMDASLRESHSTMLIDKRISRNKSSKTYKVSVAGWGQSSRGFEFNVSQVEYDQLQPGDPCEITTRKGALGFEWVVVHACTPAGEKGGHEW